MSYNKQQPLFESRTVEIQKGILCVVHPFCIDVWTRCPQRILKGEDILQLDILDLLQQHLTEREFLYFQKLIFEKI